jgi:hypothetical protein
MYKKLLKLLDRNHNKKLDWHEVLLPTPDINKNKRIDWWEAVIGIMFMITFYGLLISGALLFNYLTNKYGF